MKATASQKIKIGIFTLTGIAVLIAGIFIIGNKKNMFGNTFSIYGVFRNVGGLQEGDNIRFAGIDVGTVEDIVIINDSSVRVDMRLQHKVKPFLKNDAIATIGSDGLMGDKIVIIAPGPAGEKLMPAGGQVNTNSPVDFDKLMNKFSNVADNAETITGSLARISNQISEGKGSLGKLIYSDKLQKGLVSTVDAAHSTMQSANVAINNVNDNLKAVKHSFLFKHYFKKRARQKAADSARANER